MSAIEQLMDYNIFLDTWTQAGYQSVFFNDASPDDKLKVILRHDIDVDLEFAYQMAKMESDKGFVANYFFLISNDAYNIMTPRNKEWVLKIRDLGHKISLHFDPEVYENVHEGFEYEVSLFEELFVEKISIVSFHRPNPKFFGLDFGDRIQHTYNERYFQQMKYYSDSTGIWRYGNPLISQEFKDKKIMQILIHPLWWVQKGSDNHDKLINLFYRKVEKLKENFKENSIQFRNIMDQL